MHAEVDNDCRCLKRVPLSNMQEVPPFLQAHCSIPQKAIALHEHVMLASVACSGMLSTSIGASSEVVGRASRQLLGAASLSTLEMMG